MLATIWDNVLRQLDTWFDWLWRLLYPWKELQFSPSLPHFLQLCLRTTFSRRAAIRHDSSSALWVFWTVGNPEADAVIMWIWEASTATDQVPTAVLQAPTKPLRWSLVLLLQELSPLLWTQGEPVSSCWYPFPALLLQHYQHSSFPCSAGASVVHSVVITAMLQQASKRHKYPVCFPFSLPT